MTRKTERDDTSVFVGSDNMFADLGFPDAEDRPVKLSILMEIDRIIKGRGLNQAQAAQLLGIAAPDMSNLLRGRVRGYSVARMMRFLAALDEGVMIVFAPVKCQDGEKPCGSISVLGGDDVAGDPETAAAYETLAKAAKSKRRAVA